MDPIAKSGLHYPNRIARIYLQAMEEIMGKNGLNAILNMANLKHLIDNYPPENLDREFDFADYSSLNGALEEMYGPRGGRGLAQRAGRASFAQGLRNFGAGRRRRPGFQSPAAARQAQARHPGHGQDLLLGQ